MVLTCKGCAADGIAGGSGDGDETTDASRARLREHPLEALMNSVIQEMAVGIDHGEGWRGQPQYGKVSNNNIDLVHIVRPFREQLSALEASPCMRSKGSTAWPYLS